ncbi:MAG: sigma-54 dependent transcriptional regulator [Pseudomonadota bacterium]
MTTALRVLIVDDEAAVRAALAQTLDLADIPVEEASSVAAAKKALRRDRPADRAAPVGVVVSDMRMPGEDGFALCDHLREVDPDLPLIFLTGHGDVPMAVRAMGAGAYDFLEKPAAPALLVECVKRALERRRLVLENRALRDRVAALAERPAGDARGMILGDAPASETFRARIEAIAQTDADVLIVGETGSGKEGAARAIHARSARRRGPLVTVDCGALSGDTAARELFGHEIGAFEGARASRPGRFEAAEGGAIHLDNVETLPPVAQAGLLRVLQEREVTRLGAARAIRLDIRVIAATKADLRAEVAAGRFREDLFYRLDVAQLRAPPLRERIADAPLLFAHFAALAAAEARRSAPTVDADLAARLMAHDWPGNVREVKNAAERFALGLAPGFGAAAEEGGTTGAPASLAERVEAFEKRAIAEALAAAGGRVSEAAEALGLPRKTLYDKLARHSLSSADFKRESAAE